MSQLRVWVRNCVKCGKRFTTTSEDRSVFNWYLCETCGMVWEVFFERNFGRLEKKYPNVINPTYQIFVGKLSEKEVVEFT